MKTHLKKIKIEVRDMFHIANDGFEMIEKATRSKNDKNGIAAMFNYIARQKLSDLEFIMMDIEEILKLNDPDEN